MFPTRIRLSLPTNTRSRQDLTDASYALCVIAFWSLLEPLLGTICCCLPVVRPVYQRFVGELTSKNTGGPYFYASSNSKGPPNEHAGELERMEDGTYPLTEIEREAYAGHHTNLKNELPAETKGITVRHEWDIVAS